MVRMTDPDRARSIDLLGEHRANEVVRPRQPPERENKIRPRDYRRVQSFRTADQKANRSTACQPVIQLAGEVLAVRRLAPRIECDYECAGGECRNQRFSLTAFNFGGRTTRLGDLREPEFRSKARIVAIEQLGLRAGAKPADRDQVQHRVQSAHANPVASAAVAPSAVLVPNIVHSKAMPAPCILPLPATMPAASPSVDVTRKPQDE